MKQIYIRPAYDLTVGLTPVLQDVAIMGTSYVLGLGDGHEFDTSLYLLFI